MSFVSKLYRGSISDKEMSKSSGLLEILESGDSVVVNKGFTIEKELKDVGAILVIRANGRVSFQRKWLQYRVLPV